MKIKIHKDILIYGASFALNAMLALGAISAVSHSASESGLRNFTLCLLVMSLIGVVDGLRPVAVRQFALGDWGQYTAFQQSANRYSALFVVVGLLFLFIAFRYFDIPYYNFLFLLGVPGYLKASVSTACLEVLVGVGRAAMVKVVAWFVFYTGSLVQVFFMDVSVFIAPYIVFFVVWNLLLQVSIAGRDPRLLKGELVDLSVTQRKEVRQTMIFNMARLPIEYADKLVTTLTAGVAFQATYFAMSEASAKMLSLPQLASRYIYPAMCENRSSRASLRLWLHVFAAVTIVVYVAFWGLAFNSERVVAGYLGERYVEHAWLLSLLLSGLLFGSIGFFTVPLLRVLGDFSTPAHHFVLSLPLLAVASVWVVFYRRVETIPLLFLLSKLNLLTISVVALRRLGSGFLSIGVFFGAVAVAVVSFFVRTPALLGVGVAAWGCLFLVLHIFLGRKGQPG